MATSINFSYSLKYSPGQAQLFILFTGTVSNNTATDGATLGLYVSPSGASAPSAGTGLPTGDFAVVNTATAISNNAGDQYTIAVSDGFLTSAFTSSTITFVVSLRAKTGGTATLVRANANGPNPISHILEVKII